MLDEIIDGGCGNDTYNLSGQNGDVVIDPSAALDHVTGASTGTDQLTNIQNIVSSTGNDILTGDSNVTYIDGRLAQFGGEQIGGNALAADAKIRHGTRSEDELLRISMFGDTEVDLSQRTFTNAASGFLDMQINGNEVADTITGSSISGVGGDDVINEGGGNDRITYDANDNIQFALGGADFDTLIIGNEATPFEFSLSAHECEAAIATQTDSGGETFDTITKTYDGTWFLTQIDTFNDDGTLARTYYDIHDANDWANRADTYNAAGDLISSSGLNDDGTTF